MTPASELHELDTADLMRRLGGVGNRCSDLHNELIVQRQERVRLLIELEARGVSYRAMARAAGQSNTAILHALADYYRKERKKSEPIV